MLLKTLNISGVILAGGANTRFEGKMKPNLVIGGQTIIERISVILKDIFRELILVTNTPGEFSQLTGFKIVPDAFLKIGPLGGIHAALKASSMKSVFVFAGDMPVLDKKLILSQIEAFEELQPDILVPRTGEYIEPLHSIYSKAVLPQLEDYISGNTKFAVRDFIRTLNVSFFETGSETNNAFMNINTPEDILKAEKILEQLK
jgi:molybdopterin-guanine dinucleotide biosynthesis protein A